MTMVTSSSRISPSVRPLSSRRPRRSSPCECAARGPTASLGDDLGGARVQSPTRRAQPQVGAGRRPLRPGQDRAAQPTTRSAESLVARSSCCACPDRSAEKSARPTASRPMRCVSAATSTTSPLLKAPSPRRVAIGGLGSHAHLVADGLEALVVEGGGGEASVLDPAGLGRREQAGTGDPRQRGVLHGVLAPVARRGLQHVAGVGGVVDQQRRGPRHRERDEVAEALGDLVRKESGSARTDRKARAMSRGVGPGTPMSVGCIACSRVATLMPAPRPRRCRGGRATPTPRSSSARVRSRRPGPRPGRRGAGRPR